MRRNRRCPVPPLPRDPEQFRDRGDTLDHFHHAVLMQFAEALLLRLLGDRPSRGVGPEQLLDAVGHLEQFEDAEPALVAGPLALFAPLGLVQRDFPVRRDADLLEETGFRLVGDLARRAEDAHEPLREHGGER